MPVARYQPTPGGNYSAVAPQATAKQVEYLRKLTGNYYVPPLTKAQASAQIDALLRKGR